MEHDRCIQCGKMDRPWNPMRKFCGWRCKKVHAVKHGWSNAAGYHICRVCGNAFPIFLGQNNKWLCSGECRRESVARCVRNFHLRHGSRSQVYRARTKEKQLPDSNLIRFRRSNQNAPMRCESCGEKRVLDVAHKPGHQRSGAWRSAKNCKWPEMVWVLCPTCHSLIDRMHYPPQELGLSL